MTKTPIDPRTTATTSGGVTRRDVLKTGAATAAGVTSFLYFPRSAAAAEPLRVLCWPGYEERDVIEQFEDTHKVKVEFKIYIGGEQMLQFFAQTRPGTFDAIISDAEYVTKLKAQGAIDEFPTDGFDQLANYHPKFLDFKPTMGTTEGSVYGIPTRFSFYGISYNTDEMSAEEAGDWHSLLLPKYAGRLGMFDWYLPNMGNASLAINPGNPAPYEISDDQLAQVRDFMMKLRPQIGMFGSSNQPIAQALLAGDIVASPTGDLDIDLKLAGYDNFSSTIPKQGGIRWQEVATVCKDSSKKDLAMEWVKYMTQPDVQSRLVYTKAFKARGPNMKIVEYWDDEQAALLSYVPDPDTPGKMLVETLIDRSMPRGLPANQPEQAWIDIYNEFKTA
ncbi:extracellular solute-binding protein [Pseudooceanicola sediminis]|uniref:Extracellular solute-binding protein n=1 Tax=Pseudooceanicola sediminis TaxID=2211117 RepID=A0A399J0B2_9RHOB|nr:extracellular solute-binding protein [Pseudooceanicola sediminis]KAA2313894.1 extracellular solute-binding protein [Puniceibacterium sp. HSS470]RII38711.1 extracellular solute-binding protein [Pseudooceanicola sediminis]|tara:strand:- start:12402 stop:13571 length:1170 start_codon:yes stop_codon:yes gene_type:complete